MAKHKGSAVSLIQNVNLPVETAEAQAEDAANEKAEQLEKAIEAAFPIAMDFVTSTAQFHKWLDLAPEINKIAYERAQKEAIKIATQDVESELSQLQAKIRELEAQKVKAASAFGLSAQAQTSSTKGKRKTRTSVSADQLPNESDILAAIQHLGSDNSNRKVGANIPNLMVYLNLSTPLTTKFRAIINKMKEEGKIGDNGAQKGSMRFTIP